MVEHHQTHQVPAEEFNHGCVAAAGISTGRTENHIQLRCEIEGLQDSIHNLVCLRDRITQSDSAAKQPNAPSPPMSSLSQILANGPQQIAEAREVMAQLVEEINQSLF